jgi:nickel/cobalt exporter
MKKLSILFACLAALIFVRPASAHPADLYYQVVALQLSPTGAQISWDILPGIILAQVAWIEADLNQDSVISTDEAERWGESIIGDFQLALDGRPVEVRIEAVEWPAKLNDIQNDNVPIRIRLSAEWSDGFHSGRQLVVQDHYNSQTSVTWFYVSSEDGSSFSLPEQRGGKLTFLFGLTDHLDGAGADLFTAWESGKPSIPGLVQAFGLGETAQQAAEQAPRKQGVSAILEGLLRARERSPWFIFSALAVAALVGALHALTPGHGKTIVAAYLIGARGTLRHAVFLGCIVTLTHTGSVFLLGLITLAASQYILPTSLFPVLEILSGVLIVGLGVSLLYQRVREWLKNRPKLRRYDRAGQTLSTSKDSPGIRLTQESKGFVITKAHLHRHSAGDHHHHERHNSHDHHIPDPSEINGRTLAALGVSGGLVPCPEAVAILLLAISINRIALGLSLILAFSFGLAMILIVIGVVLVQSKRLFARLRFLDRWAYAIPVASAAIVFLLGLGLTFSAVKNAQAFSASDRSFPADSVAGFELERARVLFMAPNANKRNQLYAVAATGGEITQLTWEAQGVRDYSVSPDGSWLSYSASDENGGTNLWKLNVAALQKSHLLTCPSALCGKMIWPRSGQRALYSRLGITADESLLGVPTIWWLDVATSETGPVFQDSQVPALKFDWSPSGKWLSYSSGLAPEIRINNLETGVSYTIPTRAGGRLAWSPAEDAFLLVDHWEMQDRTLQKVYRYQAGGDEGILLFDDLAFNEYEPAWSPAGEWIAVIRYESIEGALPADDQIWLVGPDGSGAYPLTDDADTLHGKPVWSPDGKHLLFTYSRLGDPLPRLRIMEVESQESWEVSPNGSQPLWLP